MSLVVNSNPSATFATATLSASNENLQKSLNRLSSGIRIINPADDAGSLAVSMKMQAALKRTDAVNNNIRNAVSFLQIQDGALQVAGKILDRMSELRMLYEDATKSDDDKANYDTEFTQLQSQLSNLVNEKFNNVQVFENGTNTSISVKSNEAGDQTITVTLADISGDVTAITDSGVTSLADITVGDVTDAIQNIATSRANNGAETSRLLFASDMLVINKINLEAANSRIIDTDIATESTRYARYNILVQAGTAMLSQANATPQAALTLLR